MNKTAQYFNQVKIITLTTCVLAILFLIFFNVSKYDPSLIKVDAFLEDPFDAVGSFGIQLAAMAAFISFVRVFRPYPQGMRTENLLIIIRGDMVSLLAILVTMAADCIALFRFQSKWTQTSTGWFLLFLICGFMAMSILTIFQILKVGKKYHSILEKKSLQKIIGISLVSSLILYLYPEVWRQNIPGGVFTAIVGMLILLILTSEFAKFIFPSPALQPHQDFLDDLLSIYQYISTHLVFAGSLFRLLQKLGNISWVRRIFEWLNPRRHPLNLMIIIAFGTGIALLLAESLKEGAPSPSTFLMVLTVYISIEGAGVLLGYTLFNPYLVIFHS